MTALQTTSPFFMLTDATGKPVTGGRVYIGVAGQDPETSPQAVYWDAAQTLPASQPLSIKGGYIVNGSTPAAPFTAQTYSIRAYDALGAVIFYVAGVTQPKARITPSIGDFGATADGATDDSTAVQAAATAGVFETPPATVKTNTAIGDGLSIGHNLT